MESIRPLIEQYEKGSLTRCVSNDEIKNYIPINVPHIPLFRVGIYEEILRSS